MHRKRTKVERFWEILPGAMFWGVFLGAIILSIYKPFLAATIIVLYDLYWLLKACNTAIHLIWSYRTFRVFVRINWLEYLEKLETPEGLLAVLRAHGEKEKAYFARKYFRREANRIESASKRMGGIFWNYKDFYHLVVVPFVDESIEVLEGTLEAIANSSYPLDKLIIVLASEERAGSKAADTAAKIKEKFEGKFYKFYVTVHPDGLEGEIKGKSANATWAVQQVVALLPGLDITVDKVLVANFDSDTIIHPQYFARVMYEFLTVEKPYRTSYQPIEIYNNNIWDSPAIVRVSSVSSSFWQFTESSRPDRMRTFSSHSMSLKALLDVGYWKKDIVNEDAYIYWQCYMHYKTDYYVAPLFIPVSMDTCLAESWWVTLKNLFKQKRRWAYNVEYYPHLVPKLFTMMLRGPRRFDVFLKTYQYIEGNFNWSSSSLLIVLGGLLPLYLGGGAFINTVTAYQLPIMTKYILRGSMVFLIFSIYINMILLPPRPAKYGPWRSVAMYLQWILVPISSIVFGSMPAVEAQTRLMLGKYLEFFVTPKARLGENTGLKMKEMQIDLK